MKIWLLVIGSSLVGLSIGVVTGLWDTDLFEVNAAASLPPTNSPNMPALPPSDGPKPKLVIDETFFNFGHMERKATGRHTFVLKNIGQYPLKLTRGQTTCKCTLSDLAETEVPPGGSTDVTLEWTAKTGDTLFRQSATIFTNDPRKRTVTLTVEGLISDSISVVPPEIVYTNLTPDEEASGKCRIFTSISDDLQILGHTCENAEIAQFFSVETKPLPAAELPQTMKSGREVVVTVKPGLPQGSIKQKIRLQMNLPDVPDAEIRIEGRVGSPILIVGRGWDQDRGVLRLGTIERAKGAIHELKLMVRGPHRHEVKLQNPQAEPATLELTLGTPEDLGNVISVPLTIRIPPDAPTANHLGYSAGNFGEVSIETNQETGPLRFKVAFAISE